MRKSMFLPMRLQFFSNTDGGNGGDGAGDQVGDGSPQQLAPVLDYDKLAGIIAGKQSVTEDTVLKSYFKQQGLSHEDATQAIQTFKEEKARNNPDLSTIQSQLAQAQALAEKAEIERVATLEGIGLGIDSKTLPYILKMADLCSVKGQEGKINQEAVKNALNKVLEDIPQLKPTSFTNQGFQIGGSGGGDQNKSTEDALKAAFGIK